MAVRSMARQTCRLVEQFVDKKVDGLDPSALARLIAPGVVTQPD